MLTLVAAQAYAVPEVPPPEPIIGNSGNVVIGERDGGFGNVEYWVDVLGSNEVHAVAISHGLSSGAGDTNRGSEWSDNTLTPSGWNSPGFDFSIGGNTYNTASYGTFASLFGDDPMATIFYRASQAPISDSNDQDQIDWSSIGARFFVNGEALSEFIAFGGSGQTLDLSIVPEPSGLALAGIAAAGLVGLARRRRK